MPIKVADHSIGLGEPCFLVAEVGLNHNGDLALAREAIDAAAEAGADAVKFQNYRTEDFIHDRSLTYEYVSQGKSVTEPQQDLFKRCELAPEALADLKDRCAQRDVVFHSTPTGPESLRDLVDLGVALLKNGSDFLTHLPMIRAMGETGLPTVLSTGMATREEIDDAVRIFRATGNDRLIVLHCTSAYPTPPAEANLRRIPALSARTGCPVGFSDHTEGWTAAVGAVALGACLVEKHFTLDHNLPGPDHRFSATPEEFGQLAKAVRGVEAALGNAKIGPTASEMDGRAAYRLSCVAACDLSADHVLAEADLAYRRPGTGIPPGQAHQLAGRRLRHSLKAGAVIDLENSE
jgi:N-acetylneuraminate synthase/N,N'-diacetyllegionaminate synthase